MHQLKSLKLLLRTHLQMILQLKQSQTPPQPINLQLRMLERRQFCERNYYKRMLYKIE
jgi:hypothetical protein